MWGLILIINSMSNVSQFSQFKHFVNAHYSVFEFFCVSVSYIRHYVSQQYYIVILLDILYVVYFLLKMIIVTLYVTVFAAILWFFV